VDFWQFSRQNRLLQQAAKTVNKFESEQVQLRVIDALIAALQMPDPEEPDWSQRDGSRGPEPGAGAVAGPLPVG
jgi:hypothetical protein